MASKPNENPLDTLCVRIEQQHTRAIELTAELEALNQQLKGSYEQLNGLLDDPVSPATTGDPIHDWLLRHPSTRDNTKVEVWLRVLQQELQLAPVGCFVLSIDTKYLDFLSGKHMFELRLSQLAGRSLQFNCPTEGYVTIPSYSFWINADYYPHQSELHGPYWCGYEIDHAIRNHLGRIKEGSAFVDGRHELVSPSWRYSLDRPIEEGQRLRARTYVIGNEAWLRRRCGDWKLDAPLEALFRAYARVLKHCNKV